MAHTIDLSTLFPCPFCHNTTLQHYRLPSVTGQHLMAQFRRGPIPTEAILRSASGDTSKQHTSLIMCYLVVTGEEERFLGIT